MGERPSFTTEDSNASLAGMIIRPLAHREQYLTMSGSTRDTIPATERFLHQVRDVRLVQQGTRDFDIECTIKTTTLLIFLQNDSTPLPSVPKPNPKNLSNLAKIQELEQQIAR